MSESTSTIQRAPVTLLAEAGLMVGSDGIARDGKGERVELTIMAQAGNSLAEQLALVMKEYLRQVGIDLRIDNKPANVLFALLRRRQYHMVIIGDFLHPNTLPAWLHSSQIPPKRTVGVARTFWAGGIPRTTGSLSRFPRKSTEQIGQD